ncbi:Ion transport protein-domain-containing protein [Neocallimastix lanati (nom. inval.)]|nr:Ion transport protein-domain-containing protein [Neocallimastix sp. JGI-2020a]
MYRYINLSSDDVVRPEKIHLGYSLYFINALLIGNWLFLSVITAVTFSSLKKNQDILSGIQYLTDGQRKILNYLKILVTNSPKSKSNNTSKTKTRRLVESRFFNRVMLTVICISIICMMMISYNLDPFISEILSYAELCFTLIYIIELILLFKAYGIKDFFKDFWNILSFFIVFTSVISILFERYIPAAALVLIRLVRIIRLFQYSKGIKALGMAVMFNFTQLTNVLILMFLTCCIYAVIGYSYFGDINIEHTSYLSENVNFSTFFKSLTTVFIFSTGEGWPFGMADCMGKTITNCDPEEENCGTPYAVIFFISLHVVLNWILLNSFSAITVDTFINVLEEHDEIVRLEKVWDEFNKQWIEYDTNKSGEVVFTDLINIYDEFELPKGAQWGSRERAKGLLATKPPIEELFKNIKVKNNKCSYDDTIYSFLNCWMGEELPESYVKKERVVPQTGYEKKNIEKTKEKVVPQTGYEEKNIETKEKVYNIYDGYDSTAVASSSSTPISVNTLNPNNSNYNELMNANYSYHLNETDDEEICSSSSQNVETYYQFNNNNTERINILVDDAPRSSGRIRSPLATSSSSLYSYDDKCTNNSKYIYYEEPLESEIYLIEDNQRNYINNPIINNNVYNNIKTDNYYLSATTNSSSEDNCSNNSNSERTPLTSKFKYQLNHNKMEDKSNTYAGHEENLNGSNYSNNKKFKLPFRKTFTETFSKSKTVLFPGKEIFSESFSKGKAIHLPSIDTFSESFSKGKAILLPNKETFSETFSKGKAIILPKNKNSTSTRETSIEDQEIPFNVVYNIWKLQYRFKEKRQQIQECDKISIV